MTNDELKKAMYEETPVMFNGIVYDKITAIIYRKKGDSITVSAELLDRSKYCIVVAGADKIEFVK